MAKNHFIVFLFFILTYNKAQAQKHPNMERAQATLDSIYKYYGVSGSQLLRETYPFEDNYKADYLVSQEQANRANPYAYLWPYSGSLSAHVALYAQDNLPASKAQIDTRVLPGLEKYYDTRSPAGYASYVNFAPTSDRFYDDNVWLGIDFTDLYLHTKELRYLHKAEEIWQFVASGMDEKLGGGIYWCEQRKESKNTCSNAPSIVYLAKLYKATKKQAYLDLAKQLYQWTQTNLMDKSDSLYFDNINLEGKLDKRKYAYNSGQMIQAGALLYTLTAEKRYLSDAQQVAKSAYQEFFTDHAQPGEPTRLLKSGNMWFIAVMARGFAELYHIDKNKQYVHTMQANLDHAWTKMRESNGLFNKDWKGQRKDERKWLLDQFAMVEMYVNFTFIP